MPLPDAKFDTSIGPGEHQLVRHHWTPDEDRVAFYLSRYGDRALPMGEAAIAAALGVKDASLAMRRSNFSFLDGRGGLRNAAQLSHRIHHQYRHKPESELRREIMSIISRASSRKL
jgi:hypothetical protein